MPSLLPPGFCRVSVICIEQSDAAGWTQYPWESLHPRSTHPQTFWGSWIVGLWPNKALATPGKPDPSPARRRNISSPIPGRGVFNLNLWRLIKILSHLLADRTRYVFSLETNFPAKYTKENDHTCIVPTSRSMIFPICERGCTARRGLCEHLKSWADFLAWVLTILNLSWPSKRVQVLHAGGQNLLAWLIRSVYICLACQQIEWASCDGFLISAQTDRLVNNCISHTKLVVLLWHKGLQPNCMSHPTECMLLCILSSVKSVRIKAMQSRPECFLSSLPIASNFRHVKAIDQLCRLKWIFNMIYISSMPILIIKWGPNLMSRVCPQLPLLLCSQAFSLPGSNEWDSIQLLYCAWELSHLCRGQSHL